MSNKKSTTVRSLMVIRTTFGVLDRIAPTVAANWAERLWFRLPAVPAAVRAGRSVVDRPPLARFTLDVGGRKVRGTTWGAGPVVVLMHGWGGWGEQLGAYVGPLVDAGFQVVTFDSLSHGESAAGRYGPRSSTIPEMTEALRAVIAEHGPAYAVVAHSAGVMATVTAVRDGLDLDRLVMLAPAARVEDLAAVFERMLGIGPRTAARLWGRLEQHVGVPMSDFDVPAIGRELAAAGRLPLAHLAHDRHDPETPYHGAEAIAAAWGLRVTGTTGLGHRRIVRDPAVVADAVAFLTTRRTAGERPVRPEDRMAG